ncbi:hypothetical protein V6N11_008401 [Hibiscus sabdariffa]|uniref:Uncharacterized protein n=1 Tax=Hibiscus sabdariffa TaxID=183260 RepID=A0ABR2P883_9ROSI
MGGFQFGKGYQCYSSPEFTPRPNVNDVGQHNFKISTDHQIGLVNRIADVSEGQDIMECESLSMGFKDTISRVNGSSMIDSDVIQASTKLLEAFLTSVKNSHDLNTCF